MEQLPIHLIVPLAFGVLTGALAARKNRSAVVWGIFGALIFLPALVLLAFAGYVCPNCHTSRSKAEADLGLCPGCRRTAR